MYELKNFELENKMDKAYHFLAKNLAETGHNSKPVLMHSIAVSMTLYSLGYDEEIVLSAILHDLIEDTDITYDDIENNFGKEIANIVKAVSFNPDIEERIEQTKEVFTRIKKQGYKAIIVKCADLFCNMPFIEFSKGKDLTNYLKTKYSMFIEMFEENLKEEKIYQEYLKRYKELIK